MGATRYTAGRRSPPSEFRSQYIYDAESEWSSHFTLASRLEDTLHALFVHFYLQS